MLNTYWKDWCWSWNSNTVATWWEELTHWKRPWCWERQKAGEEGRDGRWDGWMTSPTQWTWIWANSRRYWRSGKPGVQQFMGSQKVRYDWATEQQQQYAENITFYVENPKDSTHKVLEWIKRLITVAQDTTLTYRNLLHFFILTMNYQKDIIK